MTQKLTHRVLFNLFISLRLLLPRGAAFKIRSTDWLHWGRTAKAKTWFLARVAINWGRRMESIIKLHMHRWPDQLNYASAAHYWLVFCDHWILVAFFAYSSIIWCVNKRWVPARSLVSREYGVPEEWHFSHELVVYALDNRMTDTTSEPRWEHFGQFCTFTPSHGENLPPLN